MSDTDFETLRFKVKNHVAWMRLNRPDRLNSFTPEMWAEMRDARPVAARRPRRRPRARGQRRGPRLLERHRHVGVRRGAERRPSSATTSRPRHDEPDGQHDPHRAGLVHLARRGAVRDDRRDARLRARCRSAARARVRHAGRRARHPLGSARAAVRDPPRPRRHAASARASSGSGKAIELIVTAAKIDADEALRIGLVEQVVGDEELVGDGRRPRGHDRGAAAARHPGREAGGPRRARRAVRARRSRRRGRGPGRVPHVERLPGGHRRLRRGSSAGLHGGVAAVTHLVDLRSSGRAA